jgi:[ribosomal protein S5]-alanine N-acetyltransferase
MPTLQTERLRLEALSVTHAEAFLRYYLRNREHLAPWEPRHPEAFFTLSHQERAIAKSVEQAQCGACARFLAFENASSEIVASVNLWEIRRGVAHDAVIGYSVDAAHQGRGYATEAVGAVIRHAFDTLNLHRLHTSYQPANKASARVLEKLGFAIEGYARKFLLLDGAWRDGVLVALINEAWTDPTPVAAEANRSTREPEAST